MPPCQPVELAEAIKTTNPSGFIKWTTKYIGPRQADVRPRASSSVGGAVTMAVLGGVQGVHGLLDKALVLFGLRRRREAVAVTTRLVPERLARVGLDCVLDLIDRAGTPSVVRQRLVALVVVEVVGRLVLARDIRGHPAYRGHFSAARSPVRGKTHVSRPPWTCCLFSCDCDLVKSGCTLFATAEPERSQGPKRRRNARGLTLVSIGLAKRHVVEFSGWN